MMFDSPWWGILLLVFIPLLYYARIRMSRNVPVLFSDVGLLKGIFLGKAVLWKWMHFVIKTAVIILFILGLMRIRLGLEETKLRTEGIDIILVLDISTSMLAEDFKMNAKRHNRLAVVKKVVRDFIDQRKDDRIGIVVFASQPYTLCPLTLDKSVLIKFLDLAEIGMIEDGTAIGSGITTALKKLKDSKAKSRIMIVLTDGNNNAGQVDPPTAAKLAKAMGVKIYTIGAGSKGIVPFPHKDLWGRTFYQKVRIDINEKDLRDVASVTGGKYYRATDTKELKKIYEEIDQLEKTEIEQNTYMQYQELYHVPLLCAFGLIVCEIVLMTTRFRTVP